MYALRASKAHIAFFPILEFLFVSFHIFASSFRLKSSIVFFSKDRTKSVFLFLKALLTSRNLLISKLV